MGCPGNFSSANLGRFLEPKSHKLPSGRPVEDRCLQERQPIIAGTAAGRGNHGTTESGQIIRR